MKATTKYIVLALFHLVLMTLPACKVDTPGGYRESPMESNQVLQPDVEMEIPESEEQASQESTQTPEGQTPSNFPDIDLYVPYTELYAPIIDAYAKLERFGYIISDKELISDRLLEVEIDWGERVSESLARNKQWIPFSFGLNELPKLMYSLYSINTNELWADNSELLIGVEFNGVTEIISIYAIERYDYRTNTEPDNYGSGVRAVFDVADRDIINTIITVNTEGYGVITTTRQGNLGETYEYFQILGSGIGAGWLDMIQTIDPRQRFRVCYIGPCDYCDDGLERISEEEYLEVIQEFGTGGYDIDGVIEARYVNLEWRPITEG